MWVLSSQVTGLSRAKSGREAGKKKKVVAVEKQQGKLKFEGCPDKSSVQASRSVLHLENPMKKASYFFHEDERFP